MFAIAAYGELTIARSGEATPSVGHVIPLVLLGGVLYGIGRGLEWIAMRTAGEEPARDLTEPEVVT